MSSSSQLTHSPLENFITQIIEDDLARGRYASICTRFPPEPNGFLHLGHAKSICLNFGLAKQYQGRCHLRFDDTNPMTEEESYVTSIQDDLLWLGFQWDGPVRYASDYFEQFYQYAVDLIKKGMAYVDDLSLEEIHTYRGTLTTPGRESPYRGRSISENLERFAAMRQGQFAEGSCCLRAKIDMSSPFIVLRDPVLYRIRFARHYRTGDRWCIYPMYDFAHPISDALEGISHSICTLEFQDNRRFYDWVLEALEFPNPPKQYEFARLQLEHTQLSKRILSQLVSKKQVTGWSDPRMPTLAGMRNLGYPPEAIQLFCQRIRVSKQASLIEWQILENALRDTLNPVVPRYMAVFQPLEVILTNCEQDCWIDAPNHPDNPMKGTRKIVLTRHLYIDQSDFRISANKQYKRLVLGKEVRLRYACVIRAERVEYDASGLPIRVYASCDWSTLGSAPADGRKVRGVIHWVSKTRHLPMCCHLYRPLFTEKQPTTEAEMRVDPNSWKEVAAVAELGVQEVPVGQQVQFEREGYFAVVAKATDSKPLQVNRIATLKQQSLK